MKKSISVILALILALGCVLSLSGCGKTAPESGKKGFIENKGYATSLENALAKPVISLDAETLLSAMHADNGGISLDLMLSELKGIDTLIPAASSLGLDKLLPFGISASAVNEAGSLLSLIELKGGNEALSLFADIGDNGVTLALPNLLDGIVKATAEELGDITTSEGLDLLSFDTEPLIDSLFNTFVEALDDTCFTDAVGNLPTADGDKEYKAISLKLTAKDCVKAFAAVLNFIADSTEFDSFLQLVGNVYLADDVASIKSELKNTANELLEETDLPDASEFSIEWLRFLDDEKTCADKIVLNSGDTVFTLFMGITSSKGGDYAFIRLSDDSEELLDIESELFKDSSVLNLKLNIDGNPVSISFNGETKGNTTVSKVSLGSGGMSLNLFTLTTTVNKASDSLVDISGKLELSIPASLVGTDIGMTLDVNTRIGDIGFTKPDISSDKVYSFEELETLGDQLLGNLSSAAPTLSALLEGVSGLADDLGMGSYDEDYDYDEDIYYDDDIYYDGDVYYDDEYEDDSTGNSFFDIF